MSSTSKLKIDIITPACSSKCGPQRKISCFILIEQIPIKSAPTAPLLLVSSLHGPKEAAAVAQPTLFQSKFKIGKPNVALIDFWLHFWSFPKGWARIGRQQRYGSVPYVCESPHIMVSRSSRSDVFLAGGPSNHGWWWITCLFAALNAHCTCTLGCASKSIIEWANTTDEWMEQQQQLFYRGRLTATEIVRANIGSTEWTFPFGWAHMDGWNLAQEYTHNLVWFWLERMTDRCPVDIVCLTGGRNYCRQLLLHLSCRWTPKMTLMVVPALEGLMSGLLCNWFPHQEDWKVNFNVFISANKGALEMK